MNRNQAEEILQRTYSKWLNYVGIDSIDYNAGFDAETRKEIENGLLSNRWKCVVSTNALGMGIDKPDIRFVIHTQMPVSPIQYYKQIVSGNVLVLSTFFPNAPWSVEYAMARNSTIYGLSESIYVAQSDDKGGTWSGVMDGLRKGREIFVRWPSADEHNANRTLVQKGGIAVDLNGNKVELTEDEHLTPEEKMAKMVSENVICMLKNGEMSLKEISSRVNVPWTDAYLRKFINSIPSVNERKLKNKIYFVNIEAPQPSLFQF